MTAENHPHHTGEKLIEAYNRMMERVKHAIDGAQEAAQPRLHEAIETAKEKATELGELTREEAEKVGTYLRRDVEDAARYVTGPKGQELRDWLRFDIDRVEDTLLEMFLSVADHTSVDLARLNLEALTPDTYHTGEITGIGTLACTQCGKLYHFHHTGHIPPCTACNNTIFERASDEEE